VGGIDIDSREINLSMIGFITRKINSPMSLSELLAVIMDVTRDLFMTEGSSLLLYDEESNELIFDVVIGEKGDIIKGQRIPVGTGIAGIVAETGKGLIVNDAPNDPRHFKGIDIKSVFHTKNILCVPMNVMGKFIGVIEVVNTIDRDGFDGADMELLMFIADQAAIAINNRRLYHDLSNRVAELTSLYDISQSLSFAIAGEDVFRNGIKAIAKALNADKASIILYDKNAGKLVLKYSYGLSDYVENDARVEMASSIAGYVFKSGDPLIVSDIDREISLNRVINWDHYKTKSFISLPISYKNNIYGVLSLADKKDGKSFDSFDLRVLSTIRNHIAEIYENILNRKDIESRKRLIQDIDIASEIQRKILPRLPERLGDQCMAGFTRPAKMIGGDFYDLFIMNDYKYSLMVADVSGKGIPAAMFMGTARSVLRAEFRINNRPARLMAYSNKTIYDNSEHGMFVSLFYAVIDAKKRSITYGNAGNNEQVLLRRDSGEAVYLNAKGRALGISNDSVYEQKTEKYRPGDMLLLFTDGVLEFLGDLDLDLGMKNLVDMAKIYMDKNPSELIQYLRDSIDRKAVEEDLLDDITIIVVRL
jgi:phosphoserine phosphatase RsbU/P